MIDWIKRTPINYWLIAAAVEFYKSIGYQYIDAPWLVGRRAIDITVPPGARYFDSFAGYAVASGEQSFLDIRGSLNANEKYVCATPCFRDEVENKLHRVCFFKVELIVAQPKNAEFSLFEMIESAEKFFQRYKKNMLLQRVPTDVGIDLNIDGIEVGSYGIREHENFKWVYGTGCAEPRLSQVIQKL